MYEGDQQKPKLGMSWGHLGLVLIDTQLRASLDKM